MREGDALHEYKRILQIYAGIILYGTVPEETRSKA
jgi:hypothetical protein